MTSSKGSVVRKTIILGLVLLSRSAWAQAAAPRVAAEAIVGSPLGAWGGTVSYSVGALGGLEWPLDACFALTGRAGFIHQVEHLSESYSSWTVPAWAGVKYDFVAEGTVRPYATVELGLNLTHSSIELVGIGVGSASATQADLGLNFGFGIELGPVRVHAWDAILDVGSPGYSMELMAGASYSFGVR